MSRAADPKVRIVLLRAAEEVFTERGFAAAKVEDIARRAKVSKGAFYLHFASKDAAFREVIESFLARFGAKFLPPSAHASLPHDADGILAFWLAADEEILEYLWQNRALVNIVQGCQGELGYLFESFRAEMRATSESWIVRWKALGFFRADLEPNLAATLICGAYNELSTKMLQSPRRPNILSWLKQSQTMFVRGMGSAGLIRALERQNQRVTNGIETGRRAVSGPKKPNARTHGRGATA